MKKINNYIIFIISLASLCIAVKDFNLSKYDRLVAELTIVFVFLIPKILNKLFSLKFNDKFEFVYIIFIILSQFLGSCLNLFNIVWWYDLFTHFLSGVFTGILSFVILKFLNKFDYKSKVFNILFIISFSLMVASFWEFGEFTFDTLFGMNVQHSIETGVKDTIEDMLIATFGSIIVVLLYLFNKTQNILYKIVRNV